MSGVATYSETLTEEIAGFRIVCFGGRTDLNGGRFLGTSVTNHAYHGLTPQ